MIRRTQSVGSSQHACTATAMSAPHNNMQEERSHVHGGNNTAIKIERVTWAETSETAAAAAPMPASRPTSERRSSRMRVTSAPTFCRACTAAHHKHSPTAPPMTRRPIASNPQDQPLTVLVRVVPLIVWHGSCRQLARLLRRRRRSSRGAAAAKLAWILPRTVLLKLRLCLRNVRWIWERPPDHDALTVSRRHVMSVSSPIGCALLPGQKVLPSQQGLCNIVHICPAGTLCAATERGQRITSRLFIHWPAQVC